MKMEMINLDKSITPSYNIAMGYFVESFFIGLGVGIVTYIFPSQSLTTYKEKALHQNMLARRPLRQWLKALTYPAVVVVLVLASAIAISNLFESSLQQLLLVAGSELFGFAIGFFVARSVDAFMLRRKIMKEEGGSR